jgi:hypothetical protein
MLEKDIEGAVGKRLYQWSRETGTPVHYLKLTILGNRGWPDRILLWKNKGVMFVEFKRPGEEPRKLQLYVHELLTSLGFEVQVHDNVDVAVEAIKAKVGATPRAGEGHEADLRWGGRAAVLASGKRQDLGCAEVVSDTEEGGHGGQAAGDSPSTGSDN